ncbi:LysR family transcriptional regulator (plasmid) [Paraburkholderia sp. PREW-6R]|uniref:LysR family transcriptional regulator n=1 Tax=Paraburkholderia sp. PREW-6R TaxID=3141544 RepID=UPI0031F56A4C
MNVTLAQMRAFIAVSRYGSFTLAAEALHRTQPAVTMQIKQLEDALALKLFDRTTRRLRLTTSGHELVAPLSAMLQQLDTVVGTAQDLRDVRTGIVRVGCLPSVASSYLPQKIANFRKLYPGVTFALQDALGSRVIALVKSGDVEFGITDIMPGDNDLEGVPLLKEQMCAVYSKGHPIHEAPTIDVEELARHDLILMAPGSNARRIVDLAFASEGRVAVPACEASYMSTAVGLVQAGLGVALLPTSGFNSRSDPALMVRPIMKPEFRRMIAVVRLKHKTLSPAAEAFSKMLVDTQQEAPSSHASDGPG